MTQDQKKESGFERAIADLRNDTPPMSAMEKASARVWANIDRAVPEHMDGAAHIHGCADIQHLLAGYAAGTLAPAQMLLVRAHLHECVSCRNLSEMKRESVAAWSTPVAPAQSNWGWRKLAVAAALIAVVGLGALLAQMFFFAAPKGMRAQLQSVDGAVYVVNGSGERRLQPGEQVAEGQVLRTAAGSHAFVRLLDASVVEMGERAEFSVSAGYKDTTVHLGQGQVIVQAAKRKKGHLYIATPDCRVAVTGTVFSVNAGLKGSRVAVVEGEVHVQYASLDKVLHSGDVTTTSVALAAVPVPQEIAWSRNLEKHLALLAEFAKLQNRFAQIPTPGLRYSSALMGRVPANTAVFGSMPNLGNALNEANQIFQEQMQQSPVLREWWQKSHENKNGPSFDEVVAKLHALSQYLGEEVVLIGTADTGDAHAPVLMAEVKRAGLKEFMEREFATLAARQHEGGEFRVVSDAELAAMPVSRNSKQVIALVRPDLVLLSPSVVSLRNVAAQSGAGGFASTGLGQKVAQAYGRGAGFLLAVDLQQLQTAAMQRPGRTAVGRKHDEAFARSGFDNTRYFIAEHRAVSGAQENRAVLEFAGPRRGIPSWLAAPAPIGSLEYVSANAGLAAAFLTKDPAQMMSDLLQMTAADAVPQQHLSELESKLNISLRDDLAASFSGDFTLALDGPILPKPSWKAIAGVYSPDRLQNALQRLADAMNREAAQHGSRGLQLEQTEANGRIFYAVRPLDPKALNNEVHYTFSDGYIIMGPTRAMVMAALQTKANGNSLARSQQFRSLLPQDNQTNVSGVLYQNLAPVVQPIANQLSTSQMQALGTLAAEVKPTAYCAYAGDSSIEVVSSGRVFPFDLNTMTFMSLVGANKPGTPHRPHP
jgi:hypothetical protein